jgi:hypothetical protein
LKFDVQHFPLDIGVVISITDVVELSSSGNMVDMLSMLSDACVATDSPLEEVNIVLSQGTQQLYRVHSSS